MPKSAKCKIDPTSGPARKRVSRRTKNSPKGRGLGHVTPKISGMSKLDRDFKFGAQPGIFRNAAADRREARLLSPVVSWHIEVILLLVVICIVIGQVRVVHLYDQSRCRTCMRLSLVSLLTDVSCFMFHLYFHNILVIISYSFVLRELAGWGNELFPSFFYHQCLENGRRYVRPKLLLMTN